MTTQKMQVDNTAFLIEKLAADCGPLQYVRELTSNSLQAIHARRGTGWTEPGSILWDVDWLLVESRGCYKLQISDNGTGMSGEDIRQYINQLSSSGRTQDKSANFGIGAKITALVGNPAGLMYKSWVGGQGVMAIVWKDPKAGYGLKQIPIGDDVFSHYAPLSDEAKVAPIDDYGTSVTLLGKDELDDDTILPEGQPIFWLVKYLNDRYYRFPDAVTLQVRTFRKARRDGWPTSPNSLLKNVSSLLARGLPGTFLPQRPGSAIEIVAWHESVFDAKMVFQQPANQPMDDENGSQLRTVQGMRHHLGSAAITHGSTPLENATAHWWLLPEKASDERQRWEATGHCAALYQDELYGFTRSHAARARLREFGVVFGTSRVVIYIEPNTRALNIYPNTARSDLLLDGKPLPWEEWATEFRYIMPDPIKRMMDEIVSKATESNNKDSVRKRLREIKELLRISKYRKASAGKEVVAGQMPGGSTPTRAEGTVSDSASGKGGSRGGSTASLYAAFIKRDGVPGDPIDGSEQIPRCTWVCLADGTREVDDLEDRAARYVRATNLIQINGDFRVVHDIIQLCANEYNRSGDPAVEVQIKAVVREWVELQLTEAVLGVLTLQGSREWGGDQINAALSEEALTASLLPRYNLVKTIRRALGSLVGARNHDSDTETD